MLLGCTGAILHVDLPDGKLTVEHPGEAFYRTYGGGSGMGHGTGRPVTRLPVN